jgi:hypothetical protein
MSGPGADKISAGDVTQVRLCEAAVQHRHGDGRATMPLYSAADSQVPRVCNDLKVPQREADDQLLLSYLNETLIRER